MTQPIDAQILLSLYFQILRIRRIEEKIVELYPQQEMRCPVHLSIGQEAIAVGVCQSLEASDYVLSNHRAHGHYLARGGDLKRFFAEIYGKESGCSKGRGGSMHLIDLSVNFFGSTPIVGSSTPVATGVAFAERYLRQKTVTVIFIGDAVVEEGVFHESINFAVLRQLPILYVCENNLYSVYTHLRDRQPRREISSLAQAHGAFTLTDDGNDAVKVYASSKRAVEHIRQGKGPAFLELSTYRWREHCGPNYDNDIGYRTTKEYEDWRKQDPLENLQGSLLSQGVLTHGKIDQMEKTARLEIDEAVKFAKSSAFPKGPVQESDVYAN